MARAGCHLIEFGVESGSPLILQRIKKGITVDEIKLAFKKARAAGIQTKAFVMVGNPGETRNTVKATVRLLETIQPNMVVIFKTMVLPNTELYYNMLDAGKISSDIWLSENIEFPYYTVEWSEKALDEFYNMIFHEYCLKRLDKWNLLRYGLRTFVKNPRRVLRRIPFLWRWFT